MHIIGVIDKSPFLGRIEPGFEQSRVREKSAVDIEFRGIGALRRPGELHLALRRNWVVAEVAE